MYGNWRINLFSGLVGSVLVFLVALTNNPIVISLLRALYSFITFFLIAYIMRFILGSFIFTKETKISEKSVAKEEVTSGQNVDYIAHKEDENLHDLLKQQLANQVPSVNASANTDKDNVENNNNESKEPMFKPLKPTQLFSNKSVQPEEMSKAIRHLTGE